MSILKAILRATIGRKRTAKMLHTPTAQGKKIPRNYVLFQNFKAQRDRADE